MLTFSIPDLAIGRHPARASTGEITLNLLGPVLPDGVSLTRASVGTRFSATGQLETVANDGARFDHDPLTQAMRGLSVEPAATNLVHHAVAGAAQWSALGTTHTQLTLNAFGFFPGMRVASGGANWHRAQTSGGGWSAGAPLTITAFYQAGTSGSASVVLRNNTEGVDSSLSGPVGALTQNVLSAGVFSNISNVSFGGGLHMVTANMTPGDDAVDTRIGMGPVSSVSGEDIIILGMQLETGTKATSFIQTASTSATRAADVVTLNNWTGVYDVEITFSDGASELRGGEAVSPGYTITPLTHHRVTSIALR